MLKSLAKDVVYYSLPLSVYKKLVFSKYDRLSWHNLLATTQESELLLLPYFLAQGSVFVDVGSHAGAYLYLASKCTNAANIYGFEPIPKLFQRLTRIHKGVNLFDIALSNEDATKSFKIPVIGGTAYLPRATLNTGFREEGETDSKTLRVQAQRLDTFIEVNSISRLDLIKIDVEGHESKVIEGAYEAVNRWKPVLIVEIEQRHHRQSISAIIDSVKEMGYACFYFDALELCLKELIGDPAIIQKRKAFKKSRAYVNNFIFIAQDHQPHEKIAAINDDIRSVTPLVRRLT